MQPFSITLFATSGDPEGIRHLDKSNWSGYGVVFNKELFHLLKQEPGFSQASIYILVGNAAEETIYIGEADPVGDRLKNHVSNKEGWVWGVYFFDRNHKIGKTEVQYLESALVALAKIWGPVHSSIRPPSILLRYRNTPSSTPQRSFPSVHCPNNSPYATYFEPWNVGQAIPYIPTYGTAHLGRNAALFPYQSDGVRLFRAFPSPFHC